MTNNSDNEMQVIKKSKELCSYIITVTQKSPKQFRFTFVSRLQNLALDVIETIYFANETYIGKADVQGREKRLAMQHRAITALRIIAYLAELAMTHKCLLFKQFEEISRLTADCRRLLGAWINSDKKRTMP